jgi:DNA-binding FrmR family transcriptional regulator
MQFPEEVTGDVVNRLKRVEGQMRGLQRMLEAGEDCTAVVTQLTAAQAALQRAGYRLMAAGMRYCATEPDAARADGMTADDLERLFVKMG